jgi:outer membrane protein
MLFFAAAFACAASAVNAQTFGDAVRLARTTEPNYLAARAAASGAHERRKIALGGVLPQLNATASTNSNYREYESDRIPPPIIDHFKSNSAQLSLTQPLYRPANMAALRQATNAASQSDYQLAAAEQELLARLATAWFDVMAARDATLFATRQVAATRQQAEVLRRGLDLGIASVPALEEARAKHEQALAERVAAEMDFHVKAASLEQVIGPLTVFVPPFFSYRARFEVPEVRTLEQWLELSANAPQILAAAQALAAAEDEVAKQRAGHHPTLDLVSTYGRNSQQVGNFPGQAGYNILQTVVGLQLNVPLFAGYSQVGRVDEAIAAREKARQDLVSAQRGTSAATKQAWYSYEGAQSRRTAALQAAKAALSALRAAIVGIEAGVKTDFDRLQAQQQVESTRRDFNKARYDSTLYLVRLKAIAGRLTDADLALLEALFLRDETDVRELLSMN